MSPYTRAILTIFLTATTAVQAEPVFDPLCQTYRSPWSNLCATSLEEATKMLSTDKWLELPAQQEIRYKVVQEAAKSYYHDMQIWDALRMIEGF